MARFDDRELGAYVDGEASPAEVRAIDAALGNDAGLRARIAAIREATLATRAAFAPVEREPVPDRMLNSLRGRRPIARILSFHGVPSLHARPRRLALPVAGAIGVVATVIVAVSASGLLGRSGTEEAGGKLSWLEEARRLYDAYEEVRPATVGNPAHAPGVADPARISADFSQQTDRPIIVPDLSAHGLTLRDSKILVADGLPSAQLIYVAADGTPLALSVIPSSGPDELLSVEAGTRVNLFHWRAQDHGYALIGALDLETLERIADEIAPRHGTGV